MGLYEIWATAALGELELGLGDAARAAEHFEHQQQLLRDRAITDADLSPAAELADAYTRLGRGDEARRAAAEYLAAASAKGQPWPLARALRCQGLLAADTACSSLLRAGTAPARADTRCVRSGPHAAGVRRTAAAGPEPGSRPRAAPRRRGYLRAPRRPPLGRSRPRRARSDGRDPPAARPKHDRRTDPARAADRAPAHRGKNDTGDRGRAVPQPEDRRIPPPPRLPETRHPLPRRTRANTRHANTARERTGQPARSRHVTGTTGPHSELPPQ